MYERISHEHAVMTDHLRTTAEVDANYSDLVVETALQLPDMSTHCRVAVNIPARQEEDRIYETLSNICIDVDGGLKQRNLQGQTLDPNAYEINVFDSWAVSEERDRTGEEVQRFILDHPEVPVRLVSMELPDDIANVGFARRLLQDVTCFRSLERDHQEGPLYIASEDADGEGFDPYALASYVDYLDSHPEEVGVRMHAVVNPVTLSRVPHLFMRHKMHKITTVLLQGSNLTGPCSDRELEAGYCSRFLPTPGYGVAYTAADMLGVGGFREGIYAEDLSIWLRLHQREIERGKPGLLLHTLPTYAVTSPRRYLASYVAEQSMYRNAEDFARLHEAVRGPEEALVVAAQSKYPIDEQRIFTARRMSDLSRWELSRHATVDERWGNVRKLMLGLGFRAVDYTLEDLEGHEVTVHHWDDVEERIRNYTPTKRIKRAMDTLAHE